MSFGRKNKSDEPLSAEAARQKAMRLLARREHSARQLSQKLRAGGVEAPDASALLEDLQEQGWQSDTRFALAMARTRVAQGYGPLRIRAELAMAGVDAHAIAELLAELDVDFQQLCIDTYRRKHSTPAASAAERAKHWRSLAQRGFDGSQIQAALKWEEPGND